MTELW